MPPRSAKKAAKKAKIATPQASKSLEIQPIILEKKLNIAAGEKSPAALDVPAHLVKEDPAEAAIDSSVAKLKPAVDPSVAKSEVEEETSGEKVSDDGAKEMDVEEGVENVDQDNGEGDESDDATDVGLDGDDKSPGGDNDEGDDNAENEENDEGDNDEGDDNADNEENEEDDPSLYVQPPMTERKKQKEFEIHVGGLHKEAEEDDLVKVFSVYGDIKSVRIAKNPATQKNKGFAFVLYTNMDHAKKALDGLKDGFEIKGKQARVSASQDNDTLYLGNISKTWTKDQVAEALKGFEVEQIENILLPNDPKNEGKINKGFAFLGFVSHSDAMAAFQRLRKPDVCFGRDRSAKVAFTTSMYPSEEALLEVKTVFVEGFPLSWNEDELKDLCKQYGEIEKVQLSRNLQRTKRKDFGFVEFTSRESALACVEGINNAELGEGEPKVKANLAKPQNKGRLVKQVARGGFKLNKNGEATETPKQPEKEKNTKSKEVLNKGRTPKGSQASKSPGKITKGRGGSKAVQPEKGKKRGGRGVVTVSNERPPKRARDNYNNGKMRGRPSDSFGNQRNTHSRMAPRRAAYAPGYAQSTTSYQTRAYAGTSGSNLRHSDLEPHGGYLTAAKQVQYPYGYEQIRAGGAYNSQPSSGSGYAGAVAVMVPPSSYQGYSHFAAGYERQGGGNAAAYPSSTGTYAPRSGGGYY